MRERFELRIVHFLLPIGAMLIAIATPASAGAENSSTPAYQSHCASCHGAKLEGGFGPALSGNAFHDRWAGATRNALIDYITHTMPPAQPGGLPPKIYEAIAEHIAAANNLPKPIASKMGAQAAPKKGEKSTTEYGGAPYEIKWSERTQKSNTFYDEIVKRRADMAANLSPVTDAMLLNPPAQDWLMWRRTSDTLGHSPLKQIDRTNANRLTLAWSLALSPGMNGLVPLVHDGVMFVNTNNTVIAMDATTGDALWEYKGRAIVNTRMPFSQPRVMTIYENRLYVPTLDGHMQAIDVRNGTLIWDHEIFGPKDALQLTTGPLAAHGKIIQGVAGCQGTGYPGGCFIVALDAKTGQEVWRFHTIAREDQPGGDSWNGAEVNKRYGASVWTTGSYDAQLGLVYFGTGQTYEVSTLLKPNARKGKSEDALFTDSTLALDPDTGKLVWYYQHFPGDVWDLDWSFERQIVTLDGPDGARKVIITGGKPGVFDALDAKIGTYLFSVDFGLQTLVNGIDPKTGRKSVNPKAVFGAGRSSFVCPFAGGGRNWQAASLDPTTNTLYVPLVESCMDVSLPPEGASVGAPWELKERPDSDGNYGRVAALDLRTKKIVWTSRHRAPQSSAILSTAGGLIFEAARNRTFRALDSSTGKTLWETRLADAAYSFPITYSASGDQYIAIISGGGTPLDYSFRPLTPEIPNTSGARTVFVFKLGSNP